MAEVYSSRGSSSDCESSPQYLYKNADEAFEELFVKGVLPDRLKNEILMLKNIMKDITEGSNESTTRKPGDRDVSQLNPKLPVTSTNDMNSKNPDEATKSEKSSTGGHSITDTNSGEKVAKDHKKKPKKSFRDKKTKGSNTGSDILTHSSSPSANTDIKGPTSKFTEKETVTRRSIENDHEHAANTWKCEHCTLDNPHNIYICNVCGKSNDEQKDRNISESHAMKNQRRRSGRSSEIDADDNHYNTQVTASGKPKHGSSKASKGHKPSAMSIDGINSKNPGNASKLKTFSTDGYSSTDGNLGGSREENRGKKSEKMNTSDKNAKESRKGSDRLTRGCHDNFGAAIQGSTNKKSLKKGNGNKQPIETYQVSATSTWKCENCTMDNPQTKYICDICGKSNAKQRDRINLEAGKVKDQRHQPGKLPKEILSIFQGCDTQEKSIPKSKQSAENDEEFDFGEYKDGEDPFESYGQPGQSRDNDGNKQPNQINQNKTPTWTCEHCTLENPLNQYICDSCSKTNDELRTTIGDENGAVQKQKRQTFESKEGTATGHEGVNINWQPVNVEQYADANGWQCGHCTMANPLDQYICTGCGKTNAEQRENIGHEKGVEQKHDLQKSKSSKDHSTESKFKDDQNYYNRDMDAEHSNSLASLSSEEIKDLNADENWVEPDNALEQRQWFQKPMTFFSNLLSYFRSKGNEKEALRIIELSRIPWGSQNSEIKRNYRKIVANGRMESGSQGAEIAAILQYIYPQVDFNFIVDSLLQNKEDIEKTIKAIPKHQKKK